ncbi:hypothetical protein B0H14DRAFT_3046275 [Mycena olivaceomarginata]|nr:hypothetical protein B0H14DRAFT_3046275 [Mycena olivaceomarginata]
MSTEVNRDVPTGPGNPVSTLFLFNPHHHHLSPTLYCRLSDMSHKQSAVTSSGTNSKGNLWRTHEDGSYSYDNLDGSTYRNDGKGSSNYTSPSGHQVNKYATSVPPPPPPVQTQPTLPQHTMVSQSSDSSHRSCCCIQ